MTDNIYASLPPLPTDDEIAAHREDQISHGYLFPLHGTSLGRDEVIQAHVRRLNVTEEAVIDALPSHLRQTVFEGVKEYERLQKQHAARGATGVGSTLEEMVANNKKGMKAANAFAMAAFIRPRLVLTKDQVNGDPNTWVIDRVATEDRLLLFMACMDADSNAAGLLKSFRPEGRSDVPDVAPQPNPAAALYAVEPARPGV